MALRRFLPDLILISLAFVACVRIAIQSGGWRKSAALAGSVGFGAGLLVTLMEAARIDAGYRLLMVSGLAFGFAACLLWALAMHKIAPHAPLDPQRRKLITNAVAAAPVAIFGYGVLSGRKRFQLQEVDLPVPGLAADLDGLRLVQLSDIHLSPYLSRADLAWCVDLANEGRPQVAFVTGDLITGLHDSIPDCLDELKRLRVDAGVFGCMGNHEDYIEAKQFTQEEAARRGFEFLRMQQRSLRFGDARLNIAGVDHQWQRENYLEGADKLIRRGELNLLMSHNPDVFPQAAAQGWDVTLSGHMHGGQINLELANANLNLGRFVTKYVAGHYQIGPSSIYVSRGIGTVGVPVRIGAPPEVTLIRLRRA